MIATATEHRQRAIYYTRCTYEAGSATVALCMKQRRDAGLDGTAAVR